MVHIANTIQTINMQEYFFLQRLIKKEILNCTLPDLVKIENCILSTKLCKTLYQLLQKYSHACCIN